VLCGCVGSRQLADVPNGALVVVPNASEIRRTSEYNGAIHYVVDDPYPGEVTIAYIEGTMSKSGWRMSPRSIVRLDGIDGAPTWWTYGKAPDIKVYQWDAGWSNDTGDSSHIWCDTRVTAQHGGAADARERRLRQGRYRQETARRAEYEITK
jgi:hypothetical protein